VSAHLTVDDVVPRFSSMTVEVTTQCSLKCVGCARTISQAAGTWRDRHMSAALFARIAPNLPHLDCLVLHGIGEPTLNPEYPQIVALAAATGQFRKIMANSHALSRSTGYYHQLAAAGLTHLAISVDSLTQPVADRTRTGTDVERLRRRLTALAELPIPVSITMVASRFNIDDIATTLDALDTIGRFSVQVQPFFDLGRPDGCLTPRDVARLRRELGAAAERWPNLTVNAVLALSEVAPPALCNAPWTGPAVTVDGYLTPCCVMWDPATLGHINIAEVSVETAFALPAFKAFLSGYLRRAPGFCGGCQNNARPVAESFVPLMRHPSERIAV
jgi:MoaA/NifB/PqqE/SkfB family radical SAM enzyme